MTKVKEKQQPAKSKEEVSAENIALAAYYHWLERGCPSDDPLTDWLEVEKKFPASHLHN
jgi:hypothetical protein